MTGLQWRPYGPSAVLFEFDDPDERWSLRCEPADELVVGARTVLVRFDPRRTRVDDILSAADLDDTAVAAPRTHHIPVVYDGPDLAPVADACGLSVSEVVARHTGTVFRAEFCGFAAGFAYLSGIDPALHMPRRTSPRPEVPAGAVAIAGPYSAVYPTPSPGGWQLLGATDVPLFDPTADPPALIVPGDLVRFEAH